MLCLYYYFTRLKSFIDIEILLYFFLNTIFEISRFFLKDGARFLNNVFVLCWFLKYFVVPYLRCFCQEPGLMLFFCFLNPHHVQQIFARIYYTTKSRILKIPKWLYFMWPLTAPTVVNGRTGFKDINFNKCFWNLKFI